MEWIAAFLGAVGGIAAHDLAGQALTGSGRLRPFRGTCPRCGQSRGWLRRSCPECGRSVGRELAVVVVAAGVMVGFGNAVEFGWALIPYGLFLVLSMSLLLTDVDQLRIVDRLNLRGTAGAASALAVAALATGQGGALLRGLGAATAYFAGSFIVYVLARGRGFGGGDVKLAPQLGLFAGFLSWGTLGWAVFATAMIGGLMAVGMIVFGSAGRHSELPYGPAMVVGAWVAIMLAGVGAFPIPT